MQPMFVVTHGKVLRGVHPLHGVSKLIRVHMTDTVHGKQHREHATLPFRSKYRFVGGVQDLTKAVHPAQVVDTVHQTLQCYWAFTGLFVIPAPFIESRLMISTS